MTESERIKYALVNVSLLARSDRYYSMLHGLVQIVKIITITVLIVDRLLIGVKNNEKR